MSVHACNTCQAAWLRGTNNGTGNATSRSVITLSQLQLEIRARRLHLGVHYGNDNLQGQLVGLAVADAILRSNAIRVTVAERQWIPCQLAFSPPSQR